MALRKIGVVVRLQIQQESLKRGRSPNRYYDPASLLLVDTLRLSEEGVVGLVDVEGQHAPREVLDVHHFGHYDSKNRGDNDISFNFTSHYARMRERFGKHFEIGCAGENILIETDEEFEVSALDDDVTIKTARGKTVRLTKVCPAAPCAPFSEYALNGQQKPSRDEMRETLQFLDNGTRGFYAQQPGPPVIITVGDEVFVSE